MSNLFFFWGQEDFLINLETEKIKSKFIDKNFESMAYKRIYDPGFNDVVNALQSLPMMFGNVMHVIDVNKFFLAKEKDDTSDIIDDFALKQYENALQNISDKNIVVLRCVIPPDSKKKVDTRKKIYKITSKYAQEKQFPIYRAYEKELPKIINDIGKNNGLELSDKVVKNIIEQIGTSLGIINSELQKLALTIYPKTRPDEADIWNICVKNDDVFSILLPIFNNNISSALYEFKKVSEKISIPEILAAMQYSLRNYTAIKILYPKIGKYDISQKLHIREFIAEKNYNDVSNISEKTLLRLRRNLIKAEYSIKTGDCVNPETAIEMALMGVCDV